VHLLGELQLRRGETFIHASAWGRRSAKRLLAYLVLHPEGSAREVVAEALWPGLEPGAADRALTTALTCLRGVLEPPANKKSLVGGHRLERRAPIIRLNWLASDWVDIDFLRQTRHPTDLTLNRLIDGLDESTRELLPEYLDEDWTHHLREQLKEKWCRLSLHVAYRLSQCGQRDYAIERLQVLLNLDTGQEEAARLLMQLLTAEGRRTEALRTYARLEAYLWNELGVVPEEPSVALRHSIKHLAS
jgi:DNA-binding SARP family transcriptional activator